MHGLLIAAVARIVDAGAGLFIAELDGSDGIHIDFRPLKTQAECLRQLEIVANRMGYKVRLDPALGKVGSRRDGGRNAYSGLDASVVEGGGYTTLDSDALARQEREEHNARVKERNNSSFMRWVRGNRAPAGGVS